MRAFAVPGDIKNQLFLILSSLSLLKVMKVSVSVLYYNWYLLGVLFKISTFFVNRSPPLGVLAWRYFGVRLRG